MVLSLNILKLELLHSDSRSTTDISKLRMRGNILIVLVALFTTSSSFQTHSLAAHPRELSISSSVSLSRVSYDVPPATAIRVARSETRDNWESIYNFFREKLRFKRLQQEGHSQTHAERNDEAGADTSDHIGSSDIVATLDDSANTEVPTRTDITGTESTLSTLAEGNDSQSATPTAASSNPASSTTESLEPTPSHKSFLPHWSYRKSSIAAAVVISITATVAFIVLVVLLVRRLRQSWKRYRKRKREYANSKYFAISPLDDNIAAYTFATPESRMSRETLMFGRSRSNSMTYVVEEAVEKGAVTRVICASKNIISASPLDFISAGRKPDANFKHGSVPEHQSEPDVLKEPGRAGFVSKRVVIVSSPPSPVESVSASEIGRQSLSRRSEIGRQSWSRPSEIGRRSWSRPNEGDDLYEWLKSTVKRPKEAHESSIKPSDSDANNLFRLPSIKRTTSPLFSF